MHPQYGGEEHTQGDRKASPEQEGAGKGVVGGRAVGVGWGGSLTGSCSFTICGLIDPGNT